MNIKFRVVVTDFSSGVRLEDVFDEYWQAYRSWLKHAPKLGAADCRQMLGYHMPELLGLYDVLLGRFGGGEEVGRFLTLYRPPPLVRACTQLVLNDVSGPVLMRSYDHHPDLFDRLVLRADWGGVATLAVTDCIWGALDGINEHGLAVALAFGGRNAVGDGFAAPLVCRYVLQTCKNVDEARATLSRVPVYMPYTFAIVDSEGEFVTAFCGPDRPPMFVTRRASANHQGSVEWERYARFTQSEARLTRAESLLAEEGGAAQRRRAFLTPPLWRTDYRKASGTLYVAEYSTVAKSLSLHWPGHTEHISLNSSVERTFSVTLPRTVDTQGATAPPPPSGER